ncbi:MAG: hypothetical protein DIU80_022890, partial [Chloroflexota bacterium]
VELTVEPRIMIFLPLMVEEPSDRAVGGGATRGVSWGVRAGVQLHARGEGLRLGRPFFRAE